MIIDSGLSDLSDTKSGRLISNSQTNKFDFWIKKQSIFNSQIIDLNVFANFSNNSSSLSQQVFGLRRFRLSILQNLSNTQFVTNQVKYTLPEAISISVIYLKHRFKTPLQRFRRIILYWL
uniref:Uncharacterized protein n=1 Tax=Cacopsylla melanoneura TaxID=428564 RepID=A0A8D9B9R3_9HEMI